MQSYDVDVAIIGAGIAGIAAAYYLATEHKRTRLLILDMGQPMALTSAASGENYRNWWPHPTMTALTDTSISLMEDIARRTSNRFHMTRRGYVLATRRPRPEDLIRQLDASYGTAPEGAIRIHESASARYEPSVSADWEAAPGGVDVLLDRELIRRHFPYFDPDIATILHVRRAGDISGQQLGQYMLEEIRAAGGRFRQARVTAIRSNGRFTLETEANDAREIVRADVIINAAGPFAAHVSALHGESLPIINVLQQKIAFPDQQGAISRQMPFSIDLDGQSIEWTPEEREALSTDPNLARFLEPMPGNIHCRPDGGERGTWIKLGWAYNSTPSAPMLEPPLDPNFPEIVLRGASRLHPRLKPYIAAMPRERIHYGGYYPMTAENWPLIGPAKTPGIFLITALSGYGTMAACAAGDMCARWVTGAAPSTLARQLSFERYEDEALMAGAAGTAHRGHL